MKKIKIQVEFEVDPDYFYPADEGNMPLKSQLKKVMKEEFEDLEILIHWLSHNWKNYKVKVK